MNEEKDLQKRKSLRLKNFDYNSTGAYFVTICTKNKECILSDIVDSVGVGASTTRNVQVQLTDIGIIVQKHLLSSERTSGVKIDRYVIMPNHIHAIILLDSSKYNVAATPSGEKLPLVISAIKRFCAKEIGANIFQRGYYEHVIRNKDEYKETVKYICDNPIKWEFDKSV